MQTLCMLVTCLYSKAHLVLCVCFSRPLYVTVVYQGKYSHCMRIGVAVPLNSTVYRLRDAVSRETKIPMDQVLFLSHISSSGSDRVRLCYSHTMLAHAAPEASSAAEQQFVIRPGTV